MVIMAKMNTVNRCHYTQFGSKWKPRPAVFILQELCSCRERESSFHKARCVSVIRVVGWTLISGRRLMRNKSDRGCPFGCILRLYTQQLATLSLSIFNTRPWVKARYLCNSYIYTQVPTVFSCFSLLLSAHWSGGFCCVNISNLNTPSAHLSLSIPTFRKRRLECSQVTLYRTRETAVMVLCRLLFPAERWIHGGPSSLRPLNWMLILTPFGLVCSLWLEWAALFTNVWSREKYVQL